jgi:histidinol-phosphate aminotransferase
MKNIMNKLAISDLVRPNIRALKPYTCARDLYQKGVLLDANENPFGSVVTLPEDNNLNRYPDPYSKVLKRALAKFLKLTAKNIFVGVGSDEVIDLLMRIFVDQDEEIIIFEPTYGMYRVAAEINGIFAKTCFLTEDFELDLEAFYITATARTKMVFCCSPNSPTGNLLSLEDIEDLCLIFRGIVVVDEAYIEFSSSESIVEKIKQFPNLVVTRTFSKAWGLAGLRVGYAVANEEIIDYLNKVKPPYNLNRISALMATKALKQEKKLWRMRNRIVKERDFLQQNLEKLGLKVLPSEANFLLVKVPNASEIVKTLAEKFGVIVRDFSSKPLLSDSFRVTVGTRKENNIFIQSLTKLL